MTLPPPPPWLPGATLGDRDGAAAPYQRVAGGEEPDPALVAALRGGGDALWRIALDVGFLSQRFPKIAALRAPPAPLDLSADPSLAALPEDAVAIGVVDGPVAFAHRRFRLGPAASRLDWLWLLDPCCRGGSGDAPFGCELSRPEIDALLARCAVPGGVDEEQAYRAVGHLDMAAAFARDVARSATHGTAVLGLAAGGAVDARPGAFPLMVAALPAELLSDTSGPFSALHVVLALDRMLRRAAALGYARGRPLPIVINISLGLSGGPADGSGLLERYIDAVSAAEIPGLGERSFVLPVGNERQSSLRARLEAPLGPDAPPLCWRLPPDDGTPSFLEIWSRLLDRRPASCGMILGLQPPGDDAPSFLSETSSEALMSLSVAGPPRRASAPGLGFGNVHVLNDGRACAYVQWLPRDPREPDGPGRARITVAVAPTRPDCAPRSRPPRLDLGEGCAPPGDWRILLAEAEGGPSCFPCDLFVQRDDTLDVDRPRGRQSRLVEPAPPQTDPAGRVRPDAERRVSGNGAINAYATARSAILAGGRWGRGGGEVPYSGDGGGREVRSAVTDESPALPGVRVIGTRSGGFARYSGTSMAAPVVARDIAVALLAKIRGAPAC